MEIHVETLTSDKQDRLYIDETFSFLATCKRHGVSVIEEYAENKPYYILMDIFIFEYFVEELSDYLTDEVINKINSKQAKLLLWMAPECCIYYEIHRSQWLTILDQLKVLDPSQIIFVSGDVKAIENHTAHQSMFEGDYYSRIVEQPTETLRGMTFLGGGIFEDMIYVRYTNAYDIRDELHEITDRLAKIRTHDYLCFNNRARPHRYSLLWDLYNNDINKHGLISFRYLGLDESCLPGAHVDMRLFPGQTDLRAVQKFFEDLGPLWLDLREGSSTTQDNNIHHLLDKTYYSLVTETFDTRHALFVTEKVYREFAHGHPFMVYGSPGTLEYARSLGYVTFPEMFDEAYDNVTSSNLRRSMIINNVQNFAAKSVDDKEAILRDIQPKIVHNYHNYLKFNERKMFIENVYKKLI